MKIHFVGLNALRFYAALSVLVQHIMMFQYDMFGDWPMRDTIGRLLMDSGDAVDLFFLLSGFLIFYLLLDEQTRAGRVSVGRFYWRRALRIWPLYYLIIFLGAVFLPAIVYDFPRPFADRPDMALLMLTFLGNIPFVVMLANFPPLGHLWSISIEEQFYLIAPHLMRIRARLGSVLALALGFWLALKFGVNWPSNLQYFLSPMDFEFILAGGLWACAVYWRWPVLRWVYSPVGRWAALVGFGLVALGIVVATDLLGFALYGLIFGALLVNTINGAYGRLLALPVLENLGKLTYGLYMYHPLVLQLFAMALYHKVSPELYELLVYPFVFGITLVIAWLSYRFFESPWLSLKNWRQADAPGVTPLSVNSGG